MTQAAHELVRYFFTAMPEGTLNADIFTPDMTAWTLTSGQESPVGRYVGGIKLLQSLFPEGLHYAVGSITAEDDRAVAEVRAHGVFADGSGFENVYVFLFRLRDGKIAGIREYFNPAPVMEQLAPRMQAAMAQMAQKTSMSAN